MFYSIEDEKYFNKIYGDGPFPSGIGAIPYSYGWTNAFSPNPFGLPLRTGIYSTFATNFIKNSGSYRDFSTSLSYYRPVYGPVNSIYEIEVSGITSNGTNGCFDCDSLNRKYLTYISYDENTRKYNRVIGSYFNSFDWWGTACDLSHPHNACGINTTKLFLGTNIISYNEFENSVAWEGSGESYMKFTLYRNSDTASGHINFVKSLGLIKYNDVSYNDKKLNMMDGEIILYPSGSDNTSYTFPTSILRTPPPSSVQFSTEYRGDAVSGIYSCNINNAIAIVRPYKSKFFDVKNAALAFATGEYYPSDALKGINFANTYGDSRYYAANNALDNTNYVFGACDNYYSRNSNYLYSITGDSNAHSEPSGYVYKFIPYNFNLRILGLSTTSEYSTCRSCDEFYSKSKNLTLRKQISSPVGVDDQDTQAFEYYFQSNANTRQMFDNFNSNIFYQSYYNICDHGCNSFLEQQQTRGVTLSTRKQNFNQGPCNNIIKLLISSSGNYTSGFRLKGILYFGGVYSSGISNSVTGWSANTLTKIFCDDSGPIKCTNRVSTNRNTDSYGLINCFDANVFSSGWSKDINHNYNNNTPIIDPILDVWNTCVFESGQVILTPTQNPMTPCAKKRCAIVDNYKIPQTAIITVTQTSNNFGFSINGPKIYMAPIVGGNCIWRYVNGSEFAGVSFSTVNNGYCMFSFNFAIPESNGSGYFLLNYANFTGDNGGAVSGIYIPGSPASISSATILNGEGTLNTNPSQNFFSIETCTMSVEFTDFYDIRDYL